MNWHSVAHWGVDGTLRWWHLIALLACGAGKNLEFPCNNGLMPLQKLQIADFSGGINAVDDPVDLDPTEMAWPGTNDLEIVGKGARIRLRNGMKRLSGSALAPPTTSQARVRNMSPYRGPGTSLDQLVMSTALGRIITWDNATQVLTQRLAATGVAGGPDRIWYFEQASDSANTQYIWALNGVDTPQKMLVSSGAVSAWGGTPPAGSFHKVWKTLMVVAGVAAQPQRLYYSQPNNPELWTSPGGFIDIKSTDDEDDSIVALDVIGENLVVFKQNSVWVVFDPVSFDNRRLSDVGCVNRFAHCTVGDSVFWVSPSGVFSTNGDDVRSESKNIDTVWNNTTVGGNVPLNDARMASLANRVFVVPSSSTMWYFRTDLSRPDGQHPWMCNTQRFFQTNAICSGNFNAPAQGQPESMVLMLENPTGVEQTLFEWGSKYGANDDDWNLVLSPSMLGGYISKRFELTGTENYERIRRVCVYGISQGLTMGVTLLDTAGNSLFSQSANTDAALKFGYARVRPEVRSRATQVWLSFTTSAAVAATDPHEVSEIEINYRGGIEH
jgi:hypothetical protein